MRLVNGQEEDKEKEVEGGGGGGRGRVTCVEIKSTKTSRFQEEEILIVASPRMSENRPTNKLESNSIHTERKE